MYTVYIYAACFAVGNSEGMRPLRRPRCRWEDSIRMDDGEVGREGVD
jgi:hypothetical protein